MSRSPRVAAALCLAAALSLSAEALAATSGPYRASSDRRYLVDARGAPFFVHGDSAWSAITNLTQAEALTYLDNAQSLGFNALIVEVIEHRFSKNPPANAAGVRPFAGAAFQSTPTPAYFEHVRWFAQAAAQRGIVLFTNPAYLGWGGGQDGWHQDLEAASSTQARDWGSYVGTQLAPFDNIVWHLFGDFDPPSHTRTNSVQAGLASAAPQLGLFSHHFARGKSSHENREAWLNWNYVYPPTGNHTHVETLAGYNSTPVTPQVLGEPFYENDSEVGNTQGVRRLAWGALTSGAAGHFYGNRHLWAFGNGYEPSHWPDALDDPGRLQMAHVKAFFSSRSWWLLRPDQQSALVTAGRGVLDSTAYVTAALASDQSWAVAYLPGATGTITINRARLVSSFRAQWFNPRTGAYTLIGTMPNTGTAQLTKPDSEDWVLALDRVGVAATAVPAVAGHRYGVGLALATLLSGLLLLRRRSI